ncbi:hypothetical protein LY76DRAFT_119906 [Colletotrichum caudatum]|nr:hypothetical protein LY76DRAFT_119906 [Colletotrichum caudatum]
MAIRGCGSMWTPRHTKLGAPGGVVVVGKRTGDPQKGGLDEKTERVGSRAVSTRVVSWLTGKPGPHSLLPLAGHSASQIRSIRNVQSQTPARQGLACPTVWQHPPFSVSVRGAVEVGITIMGI